MRRPLTLLGSVSLFLAVGVALPVASYVMHSFANVAASLDPATRYQLTFELDGDYYVADHDLTLSDCTRTLHHLDSESFPANGHGSYRCDVQPIGGAK